MKTITCRQMGGPCDMPIQGNTAEEIMMKGGEHVNKMAAEGDEGHIAAKNMMDEAQKDPAKGEEWNKMFMAMFDAQPDA